MCIEIAGESYKQCYQITIDGGVSLTGKIQVVKQSAEISVQSGVAPYTVIKNGEQILDNRLKR